MSREGLVLGYGNPGRGDDGLGPRLIEELERRGWPGNGIFDLEVAFQLNLEHAADVAERRWVVFVDAAAKGREPFTVRPVGPSALSAGAAIPTQFSTHLVGPEAVVALAESTLGRRPSRAWLLAVRGYRFGLADRLSKKALANLEKAIAYLGVLGELLAQGEHGMAEKKTILIIDDDPDIRSAIRIVLEAAGFSVGEAATADEGLTVTQRIEPDAVIVDLMMESVDAGSRLSQTLKERGFAGPIYLLSSAGDAVRFNLDARELGLAGIFQKPVDHAVLVSTLKQKLHVS